MIIEHKLLAHLRKVHRVAVSGSDLEMSGRKSQISGKFINNLHGAYQENNSSLRTQIGSWTTIQSASLVN